ncbi:MAG: B12-binding domain-containing radical SAM protein [Candidatus Omnitrophica bacterium]|jgi:radical SAM superfamily enzyme YgiQ (UPF0313 family)|nr:B12-binding domain-containing radical SAM protein [Candidatus Omnitrophota bacterium]
MRADITLINLNMLFIHYANGFEKERHVPLGPLYLTRALEDAGFEVDFRDYQTWSCKDPFDLNEFLDFMKDPSPIVGFSCMANLLPFTILATRAFKQRHPNCKIILGGVGSKCVEEKILKRFPWIELICRGEGEITGPQLLKALKTGQNLRDIRGISYREGEEIIHNLDQERITNLDVIPFPQFNKVNLKDYVGYGMMTSRGCPYPCTFCSVAPIWNLNYYSRSPKNIVSEMKRLHQEAGIEICLFQDEFFVSGKRQVMEFCKEFSDSGLKIRWKAFGRINLCDTEMMQAMADTGCVELRFGIESGSDNVLKRIKKGFTTSEVMEIIPKAIEMFPRVDTFYVWGFPFESMEDFNQTLFQMISFRSMGARILPSLLSLLPQTEIYKEWAPQAKLELCPDLLPEFVLTGHEICSGIDISIPENYKDYFKLIKDNPDIFSGFFLIDTKNNVLPKLELLRQFGFYPYSEKHNKDEQAESCGAHSPHIAPSKK